MSPPSHASRPVTVLRSAMVLLLTLPPLAGAVVPYERWIETTLPALPASDRSILADPDADSLGNGVEWFCGLRPSRFDRHPLSIAIENGAIAVHFLKSLEANAAFGVLEWSDGDSGWQSTKEEPTTVPFSTTHEKVEYRVPLGQILENQRLFRLAVTVPAEAAHFDFNGSAMDASRSGNDGILRGGASLGDGIAGSPGLALDGTDDYLEIPDDANLRLDGNDGSERAFTIAGWIRLDGDAPLASEDDDYTILQKGLWTRPPFVQFGVRGGAFRGLWAHIYGTDLTSHAYLRILPDEDVTDLLPGQWRHVAFARDEAGTGRLFLDGRKIAENPFMTGPVDSPADALPAAGADSPLHKTWIGRNYGREGGFFRGNLDELRVYRRALDETDLDGIITADPPEEGWVRWAGYPPENEAGTLYVSPSGNDGNPGTKAEPVATIGRALDLAHDPAETRLRVYVSHGIYHEGLDRFLNPDAPRSDRLPGELVIARLGIQLEAEPPGKLPGQRAVIKGSIRKTMPPGHPLADRFPQWDALGGGLYRAERNAQNLNAQAIYLDGQPLTQSGDAWIAANLSQFWLGSRFILNNNPANLPARSFYSAEKMKLRVPPQGGASVSDGQRFSISRGNGPDLTFEFNAPGDYSLVAGSIAIPFANGKNTVGRPGGSTDTQAELAARIIAALNVPAAASLGLTPVYANGMIDLGPRERPDGTFMALSTGFAAPLASHEYELFLKLPAGVDPNAGETELEIAYRTALLSIRVPGTRVRGFTFLYTNGTAVIGATALAVNADDVVLENNDVLWCDWVGVNAYATAVGGGLRPPVKNLLFLNNRFSYCGNSGMANLASEHCRLIGNDTSHNNWRQFNTTWHAGGFKFLGLHRQFEVKQHTARQNAGDGIWFDTIDYRYFLSLNEPSGPNDFGVTVTESVAEFNRGAGFFYEMSVNGRFFDNVSRYNGQRGFYLSNTVSCQVERNLAVGNGLDGFGYDASVRSLTTPFFTLPRTHPLEGNLANHHYIGGTGSAGNRISNNIIRNNGLHNPAHHDAWDRALGNLPVHPSADYPTFFLPAETGGTNQAPAVSGAVRGNESDSNILWKTGEAIRFGYSPAQMIDLTGYSPRLALDGALLDLKDLDVGLDGKADGIWNRFHKFSDGTLSRYLPFPNPENIAFGQASLVADRFEFLDPPGLETAPVGADEVVNPDLDGDGLYDWWEASHGLDPRLATGNDGADGDPDGDGLTNAAEFENWKNGDSYSNLATFRRETDPTRGDDNRDGKPRDLDADGLPDLWETWLGLDPANGNDGAAHLEAFLRNQLPLPLANDSDGDGLPDTWEMTAFGNLDEGASGDPDADGFSNLLEFRYWTLPFDRNDPIDADLDGLPDSWENAYGFPNLPASQRTATGDPDGDGSPNIDEFRALTNPREAPVVP